MFFYELIDLNLEENVLCGIMSKINNVKVEQNTDNDSGRPEVYYHYDALRRCLVKNENNRELKWYEFPTELRWMSIINITGFHLLAAYGVYCLFFTSATPFKTFFATFVMGGLAGFGVTAGVHRLWSHRSYKANTAFRILVMICFCIAGQNPIYDWVRDHRVHHKYSETDADPHNAKRGFFFAHVGWLMMKKHPEVVRRGNSIPMDDVLADPVVQFHQKYFTILKFLFCFLLPSLIPMIFWNETIFISVITQSFSRYVISLNFTWFVNSAAHLWGNKPYNRHISPAQNLSVAVLAMGEGWHNYHHVFPWDYKAAELGNYCFNLTTFWLDVFAKIGWVYDRKTTSKALIRRTVERFGDGSWNSEVSNGIEYELSGDAEKVVAIMDDRMNNNDNFNKNL